jgi:flagellar L-ring protein precursor FlgH
MVATALCGASAKDLPRDFTLTGDHRPHHVDDMILVKVGEENTAKNTSQTRTTSQSNDHVQAGKGKGALGFLPSASHEANLGAKFDGLGNTARQGSMTALVSARVIDVFANGTMRIEGSKEVVVNEETEVLTVSGLVRPEDIASDNTVPSGRLAEAHIAYAGHGATSEASNKGMLASFVDWLF